MPPKRKAGEGQTEVSHKKAKAEDQEASKGEGKDAFTKEPPKLQYEVLAADAFVGLAQYLQSAHPERFRYHATSWGKFSDGTDNIELGGFTPVNLIRGRHILLLCSFDNNDVTLQQFHAMIVLLQSFIKSLTVFLPFYPVATMERVDKEGVIATASTTAQLFCGLPSCSGPIRLMVYDLHTLQNRFYWNQSCVADLHTTIPLLKRLLPDTNIDCVAFPDDGAKKRYGKMFPDYPNPVTCAKMRIGDLGRVVRVSDGDPEGKHCIIIDDLVRTGGTLFECGQAMLSKGAKSVSVFCAHALFPAEAWKEFAKGGKRSIFQKIYVTNSVPNMTKLLPKDDVFEVLDLSVALLQDL